MLVILKNIKSNEISIFQDALKYYVNVLVFVVENQQQFVKHLAKYDFSIANELWLDFNKKLERIPQPINSTIKLSYHKAATLKKALIAYQSELPTTNLDRAIIERIKQPLMQLT